MASRTPTQSPGRAKFAHGRSELWERPAIVAALKRAKRRLALRLRHLRAARGITQAAAAEAAGLHTVQLVRVERGDVNPTLATLVALCHAYGVSLATLFADE